MSDPEQVFISIVFLSVLLYTDLLLILCCCPTVSITAVDFYKGEM